ncbi:TetR/AcrR family transcriptional regulator [Nesterenkonia haasae]|uniref:TetR/AcrR family transcriptional regulator n=1 Tax=Nesterenkonia haasae TaxID=2587813 RepID=UPI0013913456|nr:TetR/AcrR family transcriptional regulator [Nesterenkonia haasae]NDK31697.1 TetR/AcrR family transcriptional regulator [Nesterenkonia haasae]
MGKSAALGGRPRQSGIVPDDPREEIITTAAELFAQKGFKATRMTEIAESSGLRQSSIYYWFRSKDEILRAIMDQNRVSLTAARALSDRPESAGVRLYIVLYHDVVQMCSAPLNFFDLEEAANHQPDVFSDFHSDYRELFARLLTIVEDGVLAGEFDPIDPSEFVRTALNLNEGSQYRFHVESLGLEEMHRFADAAARTSVRAILRSVDELGTIQQSARAGVAGYRALISDNQASLT